MTFEKLVDLFYFRRSNEKGVATYTTGSILWGTLVRITITFIFLLAAVDLFPNLRPHWWIMLFAVWFFIAYPAFSAYKEYNASLEEFKVNTLCGSCRHFEETAKLCRIYDEHVSEDYVPCEGMSWEPKNTFDDEE
ncbi:MAG: hypothetical protein ACM3U1_12210 [Chloroflexota bacterium]